MVEHGRLGNADFAVSALLRNIVLLEKKRKEGIRKYFLFTTKDTLVHFKFMESFLEEKSGFFLRRHKELIAEGSDRSGDDNSRLGGSTGGICIAHCDRYENRDVYKYEDGTNRSCRIVRLDGGWGEWAGSGEESFLKKRKNQEE